MSHARWVYAYEGFVALHAELMMETMSEEQIRDLMDGDYKFNLTEDALEDLRTALNDIRRLRNGNS